MGIKCTKPNADTNDFTTVKEADKMFSGHWIQIKSTNMNAVGKTTFWQYLRPFI